MTELAEAIQALKELTREIREGTERMNNLATLDLSGLGSPRTNDLPKPLAKAQKDRSGA